MVETLVLRLHFDHLTRRINVTNILMPQGMHHQRLGKRVLGQLFSVAVAHDYELLVVELVESFFDRLVRRGATPFDEHSVQITAQTNLVGGCEQPAPKARPVSHDLYSLLGISDKAESENR